MRTLLVFVSLLMLFILSIGITPVEAKAPASYASAVDTEALHA